jgi:NAD(P)-dependent dehydrogenase (short-subunit alcohol dehydrogenase family)
VAQAMAAWGRVDVLVNNAGILRDKSFAKMTADDFRSVVDVHLMGAFHCTHAVWPIMQAQKYGRVLMTTSSSGLYGNFGQANYGAAKMALVGLMQTLSIEGAKHDIRVNCLAPTAATRMTEGLMPPEVLAALQPAAVVPMALWLTSADAPTRAIGCAGAGTYEAAHITLTGGVHLGLDASTPERLAAAWAQASARDGEQVPGSGAAQGTNEVSQAMAARR